MDSASHPFHLSPPYPYHPIPFFFLVYTLSYTKIKPRVIKFGLEKKDQT